MPFAFSQIEPRDQGQVTPQIPLSRYLGAAWDQGVHDSMSSSLYRISEQWQMQKDISLWGALDQQAGRMLDPNEANDRFGTRRLRFTEPVYEGVAELMRSRHDENDTRNFILSTGGTGVGRMAASFGVGMLASLASPVDFTTMFVPIVGSEALGAKLATMGLSPVRQALARGLVTEERLRAVVPAPWVVAAIIEGTVGQAIAEVPLYISNRMDQTPYTVMDSLTNIAMGGAFAGALRLAISGAGRIVGKLMPETKAALAQKGLADFLLGDDVDVRNLVKLDDNVIREKVTFDIVAAKKAARDAVSNEGELRKWAEAQLDVEGHLGGVDQPNLLKIAEEWIPIWKTQGKGVEIVSKLLDLAKNDPTITNLENLASQFNLKFDPLERRIPSQYYLADSKQQARLRQVAGIDESELDTTARITNAQRRQQAAEVSAKNKDKIDKLVREEKNRRIKEYVEDLRKKFDPEQETRKKVNDQVLEQQRLGKVLSNEQVEKYKQSANITEQDVAVLEKDVENLKKSLDIKDDDADLREFADALEKKMEKGGTTGAIEHIVRSLEGLKIKTGGDDVRYSGVPPETWNTLIDLVIEGVKLGGRLYAAVDEALKKLGMTDKSEARARLYDRIAEFRPAAMMTADELRKDLGPMIKAAGRDTRRVYTGMWHGELVPDRGATEQDYNIMADTLGFITKTHRMVSREEASALSGEWESQFMQILKEAVEYREKHGAKKVAEEVADGKRSMVTLDLLDKFDNSKDGFEFWHAAEINRALDNNQPVSKQAVKDYLLPVPGHYVEAGDLLVPAGKELSAVFEDQLLLDNLRGCITK